MDGDFSPIGKTDIEMLVSLVCRRLFFTAITFSGTAIKRLKSAQWLGRIGKALYVLYGPVLAMPLS